MFNNIFYILIFVSISISAQTVLSDSLNILFINTPQNNLSSRFEKQLNTNYLTTSFLYFNDFDKVNVYVKENYHSTLIKYTDKSIRDEQSLTLRSRYKLNDMLGVGVFGSNSIYSDNRKIEINQASNSTGNIFFEFSPQRNIKFVPFLGYTSNRQIGEIDNGLSYGGEGLIAGLDVSDFNISSIMRFKKEDILPRTNILHNYNLIVDNIINQNVSNSFSSAFIMNKKDFYFDADSVIEREFNVKNNNQKRKEVDYLIQDNLRLNNFLEVFRLDVLTKVFWREIDRDINYKSSNNFSISSFDTKVKELRFDIESSLNYSSRNLNSFLRLIYSERNENHLTKNIAGANQDLYETRSKLESQKNNTSQRIALSLSGSYKITSKDIIYFSALQNKLIYDTPSIENFDDRDETLSILRLKYNRILSPFFEAFAAAEGTMNHLVYLFSEKSSNNNINKVIKFTTGGIYKGKKLVSTNSFDVSANYTVYDFEDINPNYRSFTFRQISMLDSSSYRFNKRFGVHIFTYLKLSEQGDFRQQTFKIRPNRYLQEYLIEPRTSIFYNDLEFAVGYRVFSLNTFNYINNIKTKYSEYLSNGPVLDITWFNQDNINARFYTWFEYINADNLKREQINLSLDINWNF
ncbi:MAG TPA: hypothetical protein VFF33_01450 [Ignavibacteriaceae bacterium]|nr:hypothetical protein [Ignavibacteriaceae bacterium]